VALLGSPACGGGPRPTVVPTPPLDATARLARDIESILGEPPLARSFWGIVVESAQEGDTLYSLNGGHLLMPGSTLKIMTLAAAAARLGWDYAYETRLVAGGPIDAAAGVLDGDLLVVGSGDPSTIESDGTASQLFARWAAQLKAAGVRTIAGRLVGDDGAYDDEALGPGWAWDDLAGRDAVASSGLQYNENVVQALIAPGQSVGAPGLVTLAPVGSHLDVDNGLTTAPAGSTTSLMARRSPGSNRLELRGAVPIDGAPLVRSVSVDNPTLFFVTALHNALTAEGIDVRGPAIDIDDLRPPPSPVRGLELAVHRSPPLSTLAVRLMKDSQNLYAETLMKTLGALVGAPTLEGGRTAVAETLAAWGVPPDAVVQVDGSGLSRYNYVTADALVSVLTRVWRDAQLRPFFETSMAVAGRDGTLAARMQGTAAEGNVRAKTGSLANVRALAGYVASADGEPLVFAILANNFGTMPQEAIAAIDAIALRLAEFTRKD
jgi:D-alanyl-D-alanine carboxypeptidase/D-alanyl-D-alanine-endopeptidase (penicillin-binding protein 4)